MTRHWIVRIGLVGLILGGLALVLPQGSEAKTPPNVRKRAALEELGRKNILSAGAKLWFERQDPPVTILSHDRAPGRFGRNSNANDPSRDTVRGQVESAIAAVRAPNGQERVLVGWIDASAILVTDFTSPDASFTQVGLSRDGAKTFTDLGGLPNLDDQQQWGGDPSVVAIDASHFIIGSLYLPSSTPCVPGVPSELALAVSVATVSADGTIVSFTDPLKAASGGDVCDDDFSDDFLDKPFLSYDRVTRTLAMSYTNFRGDIDFFDANGQIELVTATVPADPALLTSSDFAAPVVVWGNEPFCDDSSEASQCGAVNQGSYPVVAPDGTTYVAWERNWGSHLSGNGDPCVYLHVASIPLGATEPSSGGPSDPQLISLGQTNPCNGDGGVYTLGSSEITGYSRVIGHDFPRIAYNPVTDQVLFAWNDASEHGLGDIYLRGVNRTLTSWSPIFRANKPDGTLHFLPSLSVGSDGSIRTAWHGRRRINSAETDYVAETRKALAVNGGDVRVSTKATNWLATGWLINPNFGDYTDSATIGTKTFWTWTDGRLGFSQPFVGWR